MGVYLRLFDTRTAVKIEPPAVQWAIQHIVLDEPTLHGPAFMRTDVRDRVHLAIVIEYQDFFEIVDLDHPSATWLEFGQRTDTNAFLHAF